VRVAFTNKFEKQLDRIRDKKLLIQIRGTIKIIIQANTIGDIPSIKKLKGFKNAYRVRSGSYRIGFLLELDGSVLIAAIDTRKDFYKGFP